MEAMLPCTLFLSANHSDFFNTHACYRQQSTVDDTNCLKIESLQDDEPLAHYLRELATVQPLTSDEESTLWQQANGQDAIKAEFAKRRLIESQLPLVVTIAQRHATADIAMLDLIQEGNMGLMVALARFLEKPCSDFSTQAAVGVEEAILKAMAGSDRR